MPENKSTKLRVTRAQRREATHDALLDATVESLVELGYAGTTTRGVAERAGVSQGAQQHYFPSKAALVDAAIMRLTVKFAAEAASTPLKGDSERERAEAFIDLLWHMHNLPIGRAVFELFNAARTDADVAKRMAQTLAEGSELTHQVACTLLPDFARIPGFAEWLLVSVATMRGTVTITAIPGVRGGFASWPVVRSHILQSLENLVSAASAVPRTRRRVASR